MPSRTVRRLAVLGAATMAVLLPVASPASAHGGTPVSDQGFYETAITGAAAPLPGVSFRVDPRGEWLELTSTAQAEVVVLGYLGEPYLRVGPSGVEENTLSPTVKLNQALFTNAMPAGAPAGEHAPVWHRTSPKPSVRWHDHRIHWMSADRPPKVAADPAHRHLIGEWTVYVRSGTAQPVAVHGTLSWTGKPDNPLLSTGAIGGIVIVVGLFLVAVAVLVRMARRGRPVTVEAVDSEPEPAGAGPPPGG
ncbi:MAG: hypothetical protein QOD41_3779 [Cryptosporangiaceae bacterium]|nr:hypothetical protein [Cryptosporangiaceae bacterium]